MAEKRTKFAIVGADHPLTYFVRNYLILERHYQMVVDPSEADFVLADAWHVADYMEVYEKPAIVLSYDDIYTGRDLRGKALEKSAMSETWMTVVHPTDWQCFDATRTVQGEARWLQRTQQTMVLRCFPVYGPTVSGFTAIECMVDFAKDQQCIPVDAPGYQVRTYLYEEDFLNCFSALLDKFLEGTTGIFNVGSDEEISIRRLAESVWQAVYGNTPPRIEEHKSTDPHRFWVIPDLTRTKAVTGWKPTTSIRKGIWRLLHEGSRMLP